MDNSIQLHQKELCNKLWAMANALRGNMEAYEFKNYILGMIFYYYLSDKTEKYMENLLKDDNISYEDAWKDEEYKEAIVDEISLERKESLKRIKDMAAGMVLIVSLFALFVGLVIFMPKVWEVFLWK